MDVNKLRETRRQLSDEYENMVRSMTRGRRAAEEIGVEKTEDPGDLAAISHDKHLLYNLAEGSLAHMKFIQDAIRALDSGEYGECARCGEDIGEKRLAAVPWARLCVACQEQAERERVASSRRGGAHRDDEY